MHDIEKVTVYLGSSGRCRDIFKESAKRFGQIIGEQNKVLVYGGMDTGLMGIIANNALETGARVTGVIPRNLKDSERIHPKLNQTILVPDLWERKLKMFNRADAIVVLPGGFGTIDEALEVLHWAHIGTHKKPIIFVNIDGYWNDFISYASQLIDFAKTQCIVADSVENVFCALKEWRPPSHIGKMENFPHFESDILNGEDTPIIIDNATIRDSYYLATALGLKQLGKHNRAIGIVNTRGQFDEFLLWIATARDEHFITDRCTQLFDVADTASELQEKLEIQKKIDIDLNLEKWGPSETATHIEIKETT